MYRQYARLIIIDKPLFAFSWKRKALTSSKLGIRLETYLACEWRLDSALVPDCPRVSRIAELYLNKELRVEQVRSRIKGCTRSTGVYGLGGSDRVAVAGPVLVRWMTS
jgi:hypothetical protein